MKRLQWAIAIFLLTITVRTVILSRVSKSDFLYGKLTSQGYVSGDEGINVAIALSRRGEFANPFREPTGPTAHVPPTFPFITAGIFRLFGYGYAAAAGGLVLHLTSTKK